VPSHGDIVIIDGLPDPNGVNPKSRPCVIVTADEAIAAGDPIQVVAISTMLPGPVPPDAVAMQYHPRGHPKTGLKTRCAAFARWMVEVAPGQIGRKIGHVPPRDLLALIEILDRLYPSADADDEIDPVTPDPGT
jgi:mRNA-degrading endonuclease toxin of MazEF toxin-antitoxin module